MNVLITGGTGSFGSALTRYLLDEGHRVTVFSRDETKQFEMQKSLPNGRLSFCIGDVRDFDSLYRAVKGKDWIFHCAAMKHVGVCEREPFEAVQTNVVGAQNLIAAVQDTPEVQSVLAISTDKVCQPNSVMGATKLLMERMFVQASANQNTRFGCIRFGNVVPSRGSVFEIFLEKIAKGELLMVTSPNMTRFLLPITKAPEMVVYAMNWFKTGEVWIPRLLSAYIQDIAEVMIDGKPDVWTYHGEVGEGEKLHEYLVTEDESCRTTVRGHFFVLHPHSSQVPRGEALRGPYCSKHQVMDREELTQFLDEALGDRWAPSPQ